MKLIPKAKPVKIRIKSGGEEHSSLESLKYNFSVNDIKSLLDGRIERWLKQQDEKVLADAIGGINISKLYTSQGVMDLIKVFFSEDLISNSINDIQELIKYWLESPVYRKNGENLFSYVTEQFPKGKENLNLIKYLYENRIRLGLGYDSKDWFSIFIQYTEQKGNENIEGDSEILYILGKMLCKEQIFMTYPSARLGFKLIDKAARLGYKEAYLFITKYNKEKSIKFEGVEILKLKSWICDHWGNWNKFEISLSESDYSNPKEKYILKFICQLHRLGWYVEHFGFEQAKFHALLYFKDCGQEILAKEKKFVIGLLFKWCGDKTHADTIFKQIQDYKLASYMLGNTQAIGDFDFWHMSFLSQLTFIKDHLFDYE